MKKINRAVETPYLFRGFIRLLYIRRLCKGEYIMTLGKVLENMKMLGTQIDLEELQKVLVRYCLTITESMWDAEDLAQETCLKTMHLLNGSYNHENPAAYLLRVAKSIRIDQLRKQRTLVRKMNQMSPMKESYSDAINFDLESAFQVLIKHLSPIQRTVFLLRDVFGFTNIEVAGFLRTTEGAVKAALHRARSSLEVVRASFVEEEISNLNDESEKGVLRALMTAFQFGDVQQLTQLLQNDFSDPVMAIGIVRNHWSRSKILDSKNTNFKSSLQLAA